MQLKKLKIYAKLIAISVVFLVILIFILSNRQATSVRFLVWKTPELPMFVFVLAVAGISILLFLIIRPMRRLIRDFRQMRREEQQEQKLVSDITKKVTENQSSQ